MENFIVNKDDLKTVSYYGENGVGETLEYLTTKDFIPYKEGEYVLGLEKGELSISTEPGSQFEVAIKSNTDIRNLENKFKEFFNELVPYLNSKNQMLVSLGYHPNMKIDEIKILPKKDMTICMIILKTRELWLII